MKKQLMIMVALAAAGLAACGEERAVQTGAPAKATPVAPAQPVQAAAPSAPATQAPVAEEKKDESQPASEDKKDEGEKKSN